MLLSISVDAALDFDSGIFFSRWLMHVSSDPSGFPNTNSYLMSLLKKLRSAYAALPLSAPSLSMKIAMVQDTMKEHMYTKNKGSKMNVALSISKLTLSQKHAAKLYYYITLSLYTVSCRKRIFR